MLPIFRIFSMPLNLTFFFFALRCTMANKKNILKQKSKKKMTKTLTLNDLKNEVSALNYTSRLFNIHFKN